MKLGIVGEATQLRFRSILPHMVRIGARGLQMSAVGEFAPKSLGETARRDIRNLLKSHEAHLTALNCPLQRGIDDEFQLQPRLEAIREAMVLACELQSNVVLVPLPQIPVADEKGERPRVLRESLEFLGSTGDRLGCLVAMEIGFDPIPSVVKYLQQFSFGSLQVNYDPANMIFHRHEPLKDLVLLKERLCHFHARDARKVSVSEGTQEVALGAGDVSWLAMIATLSAIEYRGWIVQRRTPGPNRMQDFEAGIQFLRKMTISS